MNDEIKTLGRPRGLQCSNPAPDTLIKNTMVTFTVEDGIKVQREQLAQWKQRLNDTCYAYLCKELLKLMAPHSNGGKVFTSGYDVPRGSDIDNIVLNYRP